MLSLLIYITAMAITPGPNTILSMANAAAVGFRKGIRLNIGMLIGITLVTMIAFAAAALLYAVLPKAERVMQAAAFIYLLYLAYRMLRLGSIQEKEEKSATMLQGLLLQLVNVKVYLLALTAISAYIMPSSASIASAALQSLLIPLICFIAGLIWAAGGSLLRNIYTRHRRAISVIFAISLLWCALKIII